MFCPCPWLQSRSRARPLGSPWNCSWNSSVSGCGVLSYSPLTLSLNLWSRCWHFYHGRWHLQKTNSFVLTDGRVIEIIMTFIGRRYMTISTRHVVDYRSDENGTKLTCLSFQFVRQFKDTIFFPFLIFSLSRSLSFSCIPLPAFSAHITSNNLIFSRNALRKQHWGLI